MIRALLYFLLVGVAWASNQAGGAAFILKFTNTKLISANADVYVRGTADGEPGTPTLLYSNNYVVDPSSTLTVTLTYPGAYFVYVNPIYNPELVGNSLIQTEDAEFVGYYRYEGKPWNLAERTLRMDVTRNYDTTPDEAKTIWKLSDETLTANLFREGIDKVVYSVDLLGGGVGRGSGTLTDSGETTKQELLATAAIEANQLVDFTDLTPSTSKSDMVAKGEAAATAMEALFPTVATGLGYSAPSESTPSILSVTMPLSFGGGTFNMNPFSAGRMGDVAAWFRSAIEWLTYVLLGIWVWKNGSEWIRGFATVQQTKGNPVVAGTGAQATALAMAVLITLAVVVAITALFSWSFGEVGLYDIVGSATANPLVGIPAGVFWFLDQLFPVMVILGCFAAKLTFNAVGAKAMAVLMAVVRFFVA